MEREVEVIEQLRRRLDYTDRLLVRLLSQRSGLVAKVQRARAAGGGPSRDPEREEVVRARAEQLARELGGYPPDVVLTIFEILFANAERAQ